MDWLQNDDVIINLALFKQYHFYHLFNPNGPKVFNYNVHRLIHIVFIVVIICFTVFSALTFVLDTRHQDFEATELLLIMFIYNTIGISTIKILVFLYKADTVWNLFSFSRIDFLSSKPCRKHVAILHKYRKRSIRNTNFFQNYCVAVCTLWMVMPLFLNAFAKPNTPDRRYHNIFNMRYPVSTSVFNEYFYAFYSIEILTGIFLLYYSVLIDNYLISFCWAIIAQFEVISCAYESIGNEDTTIKSSQDDDYQPKDVASEKNCAEAYYEDFKSALQDHINVNIKLKSFFSVVWIIVALLIVINSFVMTVLSYAFISIFLSAESFSISDMVRLSTAFFCFAFEIVLYCYLFDVLNTKNESINIGVYSCNWTKMNLRFKKLLLLTMCMNDSNRLKLKSFTNKIVNLQLFSNVISTIFNIVSVMLKTLNK